MARRSDDDSTADTSDEVTTDTAADTAAGPERGEKPKRSRRGDRPEALAGVNPRWWAPTMVALMVIGLLWIIVFYLLSNGTEEARPIPGIGYGNLAIGFGLIMAGFIMTTRWK